jgi:hypothetical protein
MLTPRILALPLLCLFSAGLVRGATSTLSQPPQPPTVDLPGAHSSSNALQKPLPALPGTKTAADNFRELLAMSPAERTQALADRSQHQRQYLEGRLREYDALPAEQRELRLRQLELTCHLEGLMKLAPSNRLTRLVAVPADLRPTVDERLRQWDLLPPKVQEEVLEYKTTANYFLRVRPSPPPVPDAGMPGLSPPVPGSDDRAGRLAERLSEFLELPSKQQQKTIETLPAPERKAIQDTLSAYSSLPPAQQKICITSFQKFSRMSKQQRDQFLQNAARWKSMSAQERETWRTLVQIVPATPTASAVPPPPGAAESQP